MNSKSIALNDSEKFYEQLPSFSDFSDITNDKHFVRAPLGWTVVITDVKGSTKAIEQGRYKDVNTIGVAGIVVVQNLLKSVEFPFVFGGDGATMLIPNRFVAAVANELSALKNLSRTSFGLNLRVGMLDVSEVTGEYICVEVAKHELCSGKSMAVFRGGGLLVAESKLKGEPDLYEIPETTSMAVNLAGLSCRWKPIPNKRGLVMTLLVMAEREKGKKPYEQFFLKLKEVVSDLENVHPVHPELMTFRTLEDLVKDERRWVVRKPLDWIHRRFEISLAFKLFTTMKPALGFHPVPYKAAMKLHSDHCKFDDMLRMIIDCNDVDANLLEQHLQEAHQRGDLYFGIHYSTSSQITCYVHSLEDGKHLHFIDGCDGGYAIAAKQLKSQLLKSRRSLVSTQQSVLSEGESFVRRLSHT